MKKSLLTIVTLCTLLFGFASYATYALPHVEMNITNTGNINWLITPAMISKDGTFYDNNGNIIQPGKSITVDKNSTYPLGWSFGSLSFKTAYTITAEVNNPKHKGFGFVNTTCVFVVSATGPGQTQVWVNNTKNAHCSYTDNKKGGLFTLST